MAALNPFLEILLPEKLAQNAVGGLKWRVSDAGRRDSGPGFKNLDNDQPDGEWEIRYTFKDSVRELYILGNIAQGSYKGIRFRSPNPDERAVGFCDGLEDPPQFFFTGNGVITTQQLFKRFQRTDLFGDPQFSDFLIQKPAMPVAQNPIILRRAGITQVETTHFTVNRRTGFVTFLTPPGVGELVEIVQCPFHLPVSFVEDPRIKTRNYINPKLQNRSTETLLLRLEFLDQ